MVTISKELFAKTIAPILLKASTNLPANSEVQKAVATPIMHAKSQGDQLYQERITPPEPETPEPGLIDKIKNVAMMKNPLIPDSYPDPLGLRDKATEYDSGEIYGTFKDTVKTVTNFKLIPLNVGSMTPFQMLINKIAGITTPEGGNPGIIDYIETAGNVVNTGSTAGTTGDTGTFVDNENLQSGNLPGLDLGDGFQFPDLGEIGKYAGLGLLVIVAIFAFGRGLR